MKGSWNNHSGLFRIADRPMGIETSPFAWTVANVPGNSCSHWTICIYMHQDPDSWISRPLMEDIVHGLLKYGRPFLWVIREGQDEDNMKEKLSFRDELE
uniref:Uncharacterized protein n=1 Tax=Solanum lycopersicum TaxID=4081 RepID=A0A3Q7EDJ5_SOLLC